MTPDTPSPDSTVPTCAADMDLGGVIVKGFCELPMGHDGWHRNGKDEWAAAPSLSSSTEVTPTMTRQFRKKPVVIEATQWFKNGDGPRAQHLPFGDVLRTWRNEEEYANYLASPAPLVVRPHRDSLPPDYPSHPTCHGCGLPSSTRAEFFASHGWVDTLEGGHLVCPGDWIIRGVKGELYPCKPDIFAATYEPAASTGESNAD